MELVAEGAEAKIFLDDGKIVKSRVSKGYRIRQIDEKLRKFRTRREAKIFQTLDKLNFPAPKLVDHSDTATTIIMSRIEGKKVRDVLNSSNCRELCRELGEKIGILHNNGVIHGDLTTSNFILNSDDNKIYFIDFGLSFFSDKVEDRAVDLHLLRQALESKHYEIWRESFEAAITGYKATNKQHKEVLNRLEIVEGRGRYKGKG